MFHRHYLENNINFIKIALKVVLAIVCYLFFTLYTIPAYQNVSAYIAEKNIEKRVIVLGHSAIIAEIVKDNDRLKLGLSGRESLPDGHGMLFVFPKEEFHGIWMKDMNFSIDVIWFNQYGEVIHVEEDVEPETFPTVFGPQKLSKYVLEVPAGFVKREGIILGDKIDLY